MLRDRPHLGILMSGAAGDSGQDPYLTEQPTGSGRVRRVARMSVGPDRAGLWNAARSTRKMLAVPVAKTRSKKQALLMPFACPIGRWC